MDPRARSRLLADVLLVIFISQSPLLASLLSRFVANIYTPLISNDILFLVSFFLCLIRHRDSTLALNDSEPKLLENILSFLSLIIGAISLIMFAFVRLSDSINRFSSQTKPNFSVIAGIFYLTAIIIFFLPYMVAVVPPELVHKAVGVGSVVGLGFRHVLFYSVPAIVFTSVSARLVVIKRRS
jgi:hypothetical protein